MRRASRTVFLRISSASHKKRRPGAAVRHPAVPPMPRHLAGLGPRRGPRSWRPPGSWSCGCSSLPPPPALPDVSGVRAYKSHDRFGRLRLLPCRARRFRYERPQGVSGQVSRRGAPQPDNPGTEVHASREMEGLARWTHVGQLGPLARAHSGCSEAFMA